MNLDSMFDDETIASFDFDFEEFVTGFRDRNGCWRLGEFEEDPEMSEYEEIVELGFCLRSDD